MILGNPVTRLVLRAMSAFGVTPGQREPAATDAGRDQQPDSPFVLVARVPDGKWGVFQRNFEKPLTAFDEFHEACSHANELAKTRGAMVVVRNGGNSAAGPDSFMAGRTT